MDVKIIGGVVVGAAAAAAGYWLTAM